MCVSCPLRTNTWRFAYKHNRWGVLSYLRIFITSIFKLRASNCKRKKHTNNECSEFPCLQQLPKVRAKQSVIYSARALWFHIVNNREVADSNPALDTSRPAFGEENLVDVLLWWRRRKTSDGEEISVTVTITKLAYRKVPCVKTWWTDRLAYFGVGLFS